MLLLKNKVEEITLPDIKTPFKGTIIKRKKKKSSNEIIEETREFRYRCTLNS